MAAMRLRLALLILCAATLPVAAQSTFPDQSGKNVTGVVTECLSSTGVALPCPLADVAMPAAVTNPFSAATSDQRGQVVTISPNSGGLGQYPAGSYPITGNATGTTGAVVGTLAARPGTKTWICGFNVSAIGGTAAVGPITMAGLVGSSMVYQLASSAGGSQLTQTFTPCIPASAINTAITITTTADGTASGVDVNSWGFQQ